MNQFQKPQSAIDEARLMEHHIKEMEFNMQEEAHRELAKQQVKMIFFFLQNLYLQIVLLFYALNSRLLFFFLT
jgi:hypothetical protein